MSIHTSSQKQKKQKIHFFYIFFQCLFWFVLQVFSLLLLVLVYAKLGTTPLSHNLSIFIFIFFKKGDHVTRGSRVISQNLFSSFLKGCIDPLKYFQFCELKSI